MKCPKCGHKLPVSLLAHGMGKIGGSKIFVYSLEKAVRIRTGETDAEAL